MAYFWYSDPVRSPDHLDGAVPERLDALLHTLGLGEPASADESAPPVRTDLVRALVRDELRGDWPEVVGDLVARFRPWREAYKLLLTEAVTTAVDPSDRTGPLADPPTPPPFEGPRDESDTAE